jgi:hypothetical protein
MGDGEHGVRDLRERVYGGWLGVFGATKDAVSTPSPTRDEVQGPWPWRGHDGAGRLITAVTSYARGRSKVRPGRPGIVTRARWGAWQRGHWVAGVRAQARTRTRPARRGDGDGQRTADTTSLDG